MDPDDGAAASRTQAPESGAERGMHIGELARIIGLSLRTIRHYDDLGIVSPSDRTVGGFRLYSQADVERFLFVKKLKPLGFTLEEVQELVQLRDLGIAGELDALGRERLATYALMAEERCELLTEQLREAQTVAMDLREHC